MKNRFARKSFFTWLYKKVTPKKIERPLPVSAYPLETAFKWFLPLCLGLTVGWFCMVCLELWLEAHNAQLRLNLPVLPQSAEAQNLEDMDMASFLKSNPFKVSPMPSPDS